MVKWVHVVKDVLNGGGVRARRGYPAEKYIRPEIPVATVTAYSWDAEAVVVAVDIFAVRATDCEDTSEKAMNLLGTIQLECSAGACQFHEKMGLFSRRILARKVLLRALPYSVLLDGHELSDVTAFSAESKAELYRITPEGGVPTILCDTKVWVLTLEELISSDTQPQVDSQEPFTLTVQRAGGLEVYADCRWETVRRTESPEGVRLLRIAKTWAERSVISE